MGLMTGVGKGYYPYVMQIEPTLNGSPLSRTNSVTLEPYLTDGSSANSHYFSSSGHYNPANSYADLDMAHIGNGQWYSRVHGYSGNGVNTLNHPNNEMGQRPFRPSGNTSGQAVSIWISTSVGTAPHPSPADHAMTYFAILRNSPGSHQGGSYWNASSSGASYGSPRELIGGCGKMKISGQHYGTSYRDWCCIANYQNVAMPMNITGLRLLNHGLHGSSRSRMIVSGLKIFLHCAPEQGSYGQYDPHCGD